MCMADDADRVTVLSESGHKARKEHKCNECHRVIVPGEMYHSERYVFEREFKIHRTCVQCMVCRQWLQAECNGWIYGFVEEDLYEHFTEAMYPPTIKWGIGRLIVGMRNKWAFRRAPKLPMTSFGLAKQP